MGKHFACNPPTYNSNYIAMYPNEEDTESVCGVLFSRSVRSSFASLSLVPSAVTSISLLQPLDDVTIPPQQQSEEIQKDEEHPILVRVQFFEHVTELRSHCRRTFKLGDMIRIRIQHDNAKWQEIGAECDTEWGKPRLVVDLASIDQAKQSIEIVSTKYWNITKCQEWQKRCLPRKDNKSQKRQRQRELKSTQSRHCGFEENCTCEREDANDSKHGHAGGLGKRLMGEMLANFLLNAIIDKHFDQDKPHEARSHSTSNWEVLQLEQTSDSVSRAKQILNTGSGVLDVAGGSGHVSMALGCLGVQSTVVDPRSGCGKLPGRDRKIWNRALRNSNSTSQDRNSHEGQTLLVCQPVVPYRAFRGWFGTPPSGIDTSFRHPDEEALPVCNESSNLLANCSAIIGLHPDEAAGKIVDVAVKNRIPFVIVPCCVFCRLFPNRLMPRNGKVVSSYEDLLEYLMSKHESIRKAQLPFQGKNIVLWSTF